MEHGKHKPNVKVINQGGQLVVTSRQIAEDFEKEHRVVVRAIENKIETLTAQNCTVEKLFIPTTYNHNGNEYKEFLLTRDGFTFIIMGFTGAKADIWKLKYIDAFNAMEESLRNNVPKLSKELKAILMLDEKTVEMDNRLSKLENNMTIDYAQQEELRELANKKAISVLGGMDSPAYRELSKKVFARYGEIIKEQCKSTLIKIHMLKILRLQERQSLIGSQIGNWD